MTRGGTLAILGAILLSLLGHAVFVVLVVNGLPCLNTLHPGPAPLWLCHSARFAFYSAVAAAVVWLWRSLWPRAKVPLLSILVIAAIVWTYWYILDPALFLMAAGDTGLGKWWMEHTYGRPFVGELYWGYGFAKYHWWLAVGQGLITVLTLVFASRMRGIEQND